MLTVGWISTAPSPVDVVAIDEVSFTAPDGRSYWTILSQPVSNLLPGIQYPVQAELSSDPPPGEHTILVGLTIDDLQGKKRGLVFPNPLCECSYGG